MRGGHWRDDRGSMPLALLITLVAVSLSAVLSPMVLNQITATRLDVRRTHALHAAQAGLDIVMGRLRSAADVTGKGVVDKLPCGPFEGNVGAGAPARYKVWIDYFTADPRGHWNPATAWPPRGPTEDAWISLNRLTCTSKLLQTPTYALLRSIGSDVATGDIAGTTARWMHGTYRFKTTNENINGGLIHAFKVANSNDLCIDATDTPSAGTAVVMRQCTPGASRQIWAYNTNLTIALVSSQTALSPLGLCLDAGAVVANQDPVKLQACGVSTLARQQWSINDDANLQSALKDKNDNKTLCLNIKSPNNDGSPVVSGNSCGGPYNNVHTFSMEASVGAGAAGAATGQMVNFSQFGRCLDITEFNIDKGYLIVWPCKQAPNPSDVGWNQRFILPTPVGPALPGVGRVQAYAHTYCMQSPGVVGSYPTFANNCPAVLPDNYKWKYYGNTGVYATSYIVVDYNGFCLTPTDPKATPPDFYNQGYQISKVTLAKCDGSTLQKWNAPANLLQPLPLKDIGER